MFVGDYKNYIFLQGFQEQLGRWQDPSTLNHAECFSATPSADLMFPRQARWPERAKAPNRHLFGSEYGIMAGVHQYGVRFEKRMRKPLRGAPCCSAQLCIDASVGGKDMHCGSAP